MKAIDKLDNATRSFLINWPRNVTNIAGVAYGHTQSHTSGRRENCLPFYGLRIVTVAQAAKLSPLAIARRRTYIQMPNGYLQRVELKKVD